MFVAHPQLRGSGEYHHHRDDQLNQGQSLGEHYRPEQSQQSDHDKPDEGRGSMRALPYPKQGLNGHIEDTNLCQGSNSWYGRKQFDLQLITAPKLLSEEYFVYLGKDRTDTGCLHSVSKPCKITKERDE